MQHSATTSARQLLVEATGTPFAPGEQTKPVVDVIDGRATNDDVDPEAWLDALEASDGAVAIYFGLVADHEWWLAYDVDASPGEYDDEYGLDGPYHTWMSHPSGAWTHEPKAREILLTNLQDLYWMGDREDRCDIRRSRVVPLRRAPGMVVEEIEARSVET